MARILPWTISLLSFSSEIDKYSAASLMFKYILTPLHDILLFRFNVLILVKK